MSDQVSKRSSFSRRALLGSLALAAVGTAISACAPAAPPAPTAKPAAEPTKPAAAAAPAEPTKPAAAAPTAQPAQPAQPAGSTAEAAMNPSVAKGKELHLLCWQSYKSDGMAKWFPKYETEVGGKIIIDAVASNTLQDKQIVSLSGRTGEYDLTTVDEPYVPAFSPYLTELSPYVKQDKFPVEDWVPVMWDAGVYEGKVYCVPFDPNVQILYYRKDLLDAKGIKVPAKWSELYDAAMKTQDRDKELWGIVIMTKRDPQTGINLWTFINCWGNEIFDANFKPAFVNDKGYAAAEFFKKLVDNIAPKGHAGYDYAGLQDAMATGKSVFLFNWASVTLSIIQAKNATVADKIGFAPALGEEKQLTMRGVWSMGIPADSKNRDAAWEFTKWFTSQEGQQRYVEGGSGNSCRFSVLDSERFKKAVPHAVALAASIKVAKKRPIFKEYDDILNQLNIFASRLTAGELPPKDTIDGLGKELDAIMKKGGYQK